MNTMALAIPVSERKLNNQTIQTVQARNVYDFLAYHNDVSRNFSRWIGSAVDRYGFTEGIDFIKVGVCVTNDANPKRSIGRPKSDYHVSLDMAKELCMVAETPKGREVRKYFIECEKKLLSGNDNKSDVATAINMLTLLMGELVHANKPEPKDETMMTTREFANGRYPGKAKYEEFVRRTNQRMRLEGLTPGKIPSEKWGTVNTYPKWILTETWLKVVA